MQKSNQAQAELRAFLAKQLGQARADERQAETDLKRAAEAIDAAKTAVKDAHDRVAFLEKQLADNTPNDAKPKATAHGHSSSAKSA